MREENEIPLEELGEVSTAASADGADNASAASARRDSDGRDPDGLDPARIAEVLMRLEAEESGGGGWPRWRRGFWCALVAAVLAALAGAALDRAFPGEEGGSAWWTVIGAAAIWLAVWTAVAFLPEKRR